MAEHQKREWEKLLEDSFYDDGMNIEIETFKKQFKQFIEHPDKAEFIDWKDDEIANGWTMFMCAIYRERWDIARLLLKNGADITITDKNGMTSLILVSQTALMIASKGGMDTMNLLLDKRADVNIADKKGKTALMYASDWGHSDIVKLLLEKGADINIADNNSRTAVVLASRRGHGETVQLLVDKGADITITDKDGMTALKYASKQGHAEVVLLLQLAADPNIANMCNNNGQTFLHQACLQNMKTLAQKTLEVGIDGDKFDDDDHTALFYAAEKGFANIVDLLMIRNADVDKTDERRLIESTYKDHLGKTRSYSFYSVKDGRTPLFVAAQNGHQNIVASLLRHGANPYLCNHEGKIPSDFSKNHEAIQQLFRIHDYFEKGEKGDAYEEKYKTSIDAYDDSNKWKDDIPPLKNIIHDIVMYPHYADKFLELYQENREIVNWLDDDGRPVQQVACKECREAILFMGRFHLEDQPVYESPTCKIYLALDYGGPEEDLKQPRNVAMKFIRELEHFLNEMRSRRNEDDGSPRFSSDFVTPDLASYRADENPKYAAALKIWKQVKNGAETDADAEVLADLAHCVVMPQAKRSLLESMNAENLSAKHKDLQRREILLTLCEIFSYLHREGYVHGDIKPHNVVRHIDGGNVTWKAIDFDACTKIGETIGLKLTTGSAPPENAQDHQRKRDKNNPSTARC